MKWISLLLLLLPIPVLCQASEPQKTSLRYTENFRLNSSVNIRLLVLKHCFDSIANSDANQAIEAANFAHTKGLNIENIGNYHIKKDGPVNRQSARGQIKWMRYRIDELKDFISEQMKKDAKCGDTFLIYTIGHGSGSGYIQFIGQRKILMDAIVQAAEENNQRTFWWQLSCHAAAKLPPISSLTEKQQSLFSMIASSPANELSWFNTQGTQMKKMFLALAENNSSIDPDRNETITAGELKDFLNKEVKAGRGELLYTSTPETPIFGMDIVNSLPIIGKDRMFPKHYIPLP